MSDDKPIAKPDGFDPATMNACRVFRIARGMNQRELAERVGVPQNLVSYWEVGKAMPGARNAPKLAAVLGIPPASLVAWLMTYSPPADTVSA